MESREKTSWRKCSRALQAQLEEHGITPEQQYRVLADVEGGLALLNCENGVDKTYFAEMIGQLVKW